MTRDNNSIESEVLLLELIFFTNQTMEAELFQGEGWTPLQALPARKNFRFFLAIVEAQLEGIRTFVQQNVASTSTSVRAPTGTLWVPVMATSLPLGPSATATAPSTSAGPSTLMMLSEEHAHVEPLDQLPNSVMCVGDDLEEGEVSPTIRRESDSQYDDCEETLGEESPPDSTQEESMEEKEETGEEKEGWSSYLSRLVLDCRFKRLEDRDLDSVASLEDLHEINRMAKMELAWSANKRPKEAGGFGEKWLHRRLNRLCAMVEEHIREQEEEEAPLRQGRERRASCDWWAEAPSH